MFRRLLLAILLAPATIICQTEDPVHAMESARLMLEAKNGSPQSKVKDAQIERLEFSDRYNRLIDAMREFTDEYNKAGSMVWPQKKADAVDKAYRDLRKSQSWKRASAQSETSR